MLQILLLRLFLSYLISRPIYASVLFTKVIGTNVKDRGCRVRIVDDYVYVVGDSQGDFDGHKNAGSTDIFLMKFTKSGDQLFSRLFGSDQNDYCGDMVVDPKTNDIYLTGASNGNLDGSTSAGNFDIYVMKFNSSGDKQWTTLVGTSGYDTGQALAYFNQSVYITGYTYGNLDGETNAGNADAFIMKLEAVNGTKIWTKLVGTTEDDFGNAINAYGGDLNHTTIAVQSKGNYLNIKNYGNYALFLTNYGYNGVRQNTNGLMSPDANFNPSAMALDPIDPTKFRLTMNSKDTTSDTSYDIFLLEYSDKLQDFGKNNWREYGYTINSGSLETLDITFDKSESFYVTGTVSSLDIDGQKQIGDTDIFFMKLFQNGSRIYTKLFGSDADDTGAGIAVDSDGDIFITGSVKGTLNGLSVAGDADFLLIKYSADTSFSCPAGRGMNYSSASGYLCLDCEELFEDASYNAFYRAHADERFEFYNDGSSLHCDLSVGATDYPLESSHSSCYTSSEETCAYPLYPIFTSDSTCATDVCIAVCFIRTPLNRYITVALLGALHFFAYLFCIGKMIRMHYRGREDLYRVGKLLFVTFLPIIDVFSDLSFLLTAKIYNRDCYYFLVILLGICYLHPVGDLLRELCRKRAIPSFHFWHIPDRLWHAYPQIDDFKSLLPFSLLCTPFFLVNLFWMVPWLLLGFFLHSTKLIYVTYCHDLWWSVWSGEQTAENTSSAENHPTDEHQQQQQQQQQQQSAEDPWTINAGEYKHAVLREICWESIPQLVIQVTNHLLLEETTPIFILSTICSSLMIGNAVYQHFYYRVILRRPLEAVPSPIDYLFANKEEFRARRVLRPAISADDRIELGSVLSALHRSISKSTSAGQRELDLPDQPDEQLVVLLREYWQELQSTSEAKMRREFTAECNALRDEIRGLTTLVQTHLRGGIPDKDDEGHQVVQVRRSVVSFAEEEETASLNVRVSAESNFSIRETSYTGSIVPGFGLDDDHSDHDHDNEHSQRHETS